MTPLSDCIIAKRIEGQSVTPAGIHLPDAAREKPQKATVIAVGPGRLNEEGKRLPVQVKEGDTILFTKYGGNEFEIDGEKVLILNERDVLAIMD